MRSDSPDIASSLVLIDSCIIDLKLPEIDEEEPLEEEKKEVEANAEDGMDSQWNKRMKERLEQMKSKKVKDMSITVTQKSGLASGALASRQRKTYNKDDGSAAATTVGQGRVREELVERKGSIRFLTGEEDGTVEICIQSILASINNPARFSLNVKMSASDEEDEEEGSAEKKKRTKKSSSLDTSQVQNNMSRLERDLQTLQNRVKACLNNADFNKDQEADFHQQSVSMNNAAKYWPMIHLIVILVTGFTQVNHIVTYLRKHHIGV